MTSVCKPQNPLTGLTFVYLLRTACLTFPTTNFALRNSNANRFCNKVGNWIISNTLKFLFAALNNHEKKEEMK